MKTDARMLTLCALFAASMIWTAAALVQEYRGKRKTVRN